MNRGEIYEVDRMMAAERRGKYEPHPSRNRILYRPEPELAICNGCGELAITPEMAMRGQLCEDCGKEETR